MLLLNTVRAHVAEQNPAEIGLAADFWEVVEFTLNEMPVCFTEYTDAHDTIRRRKTLKFTGKCKLGFRHVDDFLRNPLVFFLKSSNQVKRIGVCRANFIAGIAGNAQINHRCVIPGHHLRYPVSGLILIRINPLAFNQAISAQITSFFMKHFFASPVQHL